MAEPFLLRRIIQIAATPETENEVACVYALADDGRVWFFANPGKSWPGAWTPLPNLPQPLPEQP